MKKLVLSLSLTLVSLFLLASLASAQTPQPQPPSTMVGVQASNDISGGYAVGVNGWLTELVDRWGRTYNWMPSQTINVYLYTSGTDMADALGVFRGGPLSASDYTQVSRGASAITAVDTRANSRGEFAILVNLSSSGFGGPSALGSDFWKTEMKGAVVMELAKIMISDVAGSGGQPWLGFGFANYLTQTEVPGLTSFNQQTSTLSTLVAGGTAPGLLSLQNDWNGTLALSPQMRDASYAVATQTVRALVPKIGPQGVINLLKSGATGMTFWNTLMSMTGMSGSQLDQAFMNGL